MPVSLSDPVATAERPDIKLSVLFELLFKRRTEIIHNYLGEMYFRQSTASVRTLGH